MKNKHRSTTGKQGGGAGNPPDPHPHTAPQPEIPVRFYAEAVYAVNRGIPHIVDFPGRLS